MKKTEDNPQWTENMAIACCKTCLLSSAMKDCKDCPFAVGLVYKALEQAKQVTSEYPSHLREQTLSNLKLTL